MGAVGGQSKEPASPGGRSMSLFVILRDEQDKVHRLRDALSDLLAMCPFVTMPENCAEHNWQRRVAAAKATMKLTETKHGRFLKCMNGAFITIGNLALCLMKALELDGLPPSIFGHPLKVW